MICEDCGKREAAPGYVVAVGQIDLRVVRERPEGRSTHWCRFCITRRVMVARMAKARMEAHRGAHPRDRRYNVPRSARAYPPVRSPSESQPKPP